MQVIAGLNNLRPQDSVQSVPRYSLLFSNGWSVMIATSPNGMLHSFHISRIVAEFSGALLRRKSIWRIVGQIDDIRSTLAMESRTKRWWSRLQC
jgi:hypothetical protein